MLLQSYTVTLITLVVLQSAKYFAGVKLSAQQMSCDFLSFICTSRQKYYADGVMLTGTLVGLSAIIL